MRRMLLPALLAIGLLAGACASAIPETEAGGGPSRPRANGADNGGTSRAPVADPAPDFEVTTFDGGTFSLAEQQGTPVVLNFWESW